MPFLKNILQYVPTLNAKCVIIIELKKSLEINTYEFFFNYSQLF